MNTYSHKNKAKSATIQKKVSSKSVALEDNRAQSTVQRKVNNTGLPDQLKSGIENLSGYSMDDVKVHYNSSKPAQLNAHAYAQGTDIHLASGQEKHLPHEAWHVVQQKQGRVQPTTQLKGKVNINDDKGLEKEADVMGAKALHKTDNRSLSLNRKALSFNNGTAQLFKEPKGLEDLSNELHSVVKSFTAAHFGDLKATDKLYGSEQWGADTFWAANRKLDEWGLVQKLFEMGESGGFDLKKAAHVGFGIDDATEADAVAQSKHGNYLAAGENKLVTGGFSQIVENINSALSQLTTGSRAHLYNETTLIAKVNISPESEAYKHLKTMSGSVFKGMQTRWTNRLIKAHLHGKKYWGGGKGNCILGLIIHSGSEMFFKHSVK